MAVSAKMQRSWPLAHATRCRGLAWEQLVDLCASFLVLHAEFYQRKAASLGQDPLREDADAEAACAKVLASRKCIG
jgi:hypothetical protein